jgi:hypothetical protein
MQVVKRQIALFARQFDQLTQLLMPLAAGSTAPLLASAASCSTAINSASEGSSPGAASGFGARAILDLLGPSFGALGALLLGIFFNRKTTRHQRKRNRT